MFSTGYPFEDLGKKSSIQDKDLGKSLWIKTLNNWNIEYSPESECREAGSQQRMSW